jgi:hypothetical protein
MTTANNAPSTNQGRENLRRSPTESQIAFNNNRSSAISVVSSATLGFVDDDNKFALRSFSPLVEVSAGPPPVTQVRRLCLFLWMTDRVTSVSATQVYAGGVQTPDEAIIADTLCTCAEFVRPTNGFALLPAGTSCTPNALTDVGSQSTLAYQSGSTKFSVRGTPLLLLMNNNGFLTGEDSDPAEAQIYVDALSESLLSGKPHVQVQEFRNGTFNAYSSGGVFGRQQTILLIEDYLAGQYWNADNVLVDDKGNQWDIVGVWAEPPYFAPLPPA